MNSGVTGAAAAGWLLALVAAAAAAWLWWRLRAATRAARAYESATRKEIAQLRIHSAMLDILARSVDVPLAFQALAQQVADLVPCDRVGLALLTDNDEFQTYTARVAEDERRTRPRPEVVFRPDRTAIGAAVRAREPMIINDVEAAATEFLDVNVLHTSGFGSGVILPLVTKGRAVGTLNIVSRKKNAFSQEHVDALLPVSEIFAVAYVAHQLQVALTRHRTVETITELTLGLSSEINGALQSIIGHCDLMEREHPDERVRRDVALIMHQAQRIASLLEKMRTASHQRLSEAAESVRNIPASPEAFS
jgi:GAF domain-containing protein